MRGVLAVADPGADPISGPKDRQLHLAGEPQEEAGLGVQTAAIARPGLQARVETIAGRRDGVVARVDAVEVVDATDESAIPPALIRSQRDEWAKPDVALLITGPTRNSRSVAGIQTNQRSAAPFICSDGQRQAVLGASIVARDVIVAVPVEGAHLHELKGIGLVREIGGAGWHPNEEARDRPQQNGPHSTSRKFQVPQLHARFEPHCPFPPPGREPPHANLAEPGRQATNKRRSRLAGVWFLPKCCQKITRPAPSRKAAAGAGRAEKAQ